jgi:acyl-CoA synthetase (AMP-forming)/AMP-acid ligase II
VAQDSLLDTTGVVGCGGALDGVSITIVDERGPVPDGTVGEIAVRSPALTSGYLPGAEVGAGTRLAGGELHTGDAGFLRDGQLYVLGRMGDSVKVRGRAVFAEDVEAALVRVGIPASRVTAALGIHLGEPTVVAVVEHAAEKWLLPARSVLRAHGAGAKVVLLSVPRGSVPRTSSGKPRRRLVWRAYCNGELPGPVRCS